MRDGKIASALVYHVSMPCRENALKIQISLKKKKVIKLFCKYSINELLGIL